METSLIIVWFQAKVFHQKPDQFLVASRLQNLTILFQKTLPYLVNNLQTKVFKKDTR